MKIEKLGRASGKCRNIYAEADPLMVGEARRKELALKAACYIMDRESMVAWSEASKARKRASFSEGCLEPIEEKLNEIIGQLGEKKYKSTYKSRHVRIEK
jgi:hypothetical protein